MGILNKHKLNVCGGAEGMRNVLDCQLRVAAIHPLFPSWINKVSLAS